MYPPRAGTELTADQGRQLDDTFLSSDPFQHFRSRIASLMAWQETAPIGDRHLERAVRRRGLVRLDLRQQETSFALLMTSRSFKEMESEVGLKG
jgi:hypothetical protein